MSTARAADGAEATVTAATPTTATRLSLLQVLSLRIKLSPPLSFRSTSEPQEANNRH
ncbi:hypothetical protein GCM10010431_27270 [Streptomyces kunmingensis]